MKDKLNKALQQIESRYVDSLHTFCKWIDDLDRTAHDEEMSDDEFRVAVRSNVRTMMNEAIQVKVGATVRMVDCEICGKRSQIEKTRLDDDLRIACNRCRSSK